MRAPKETAIKLTVNIRPGPVTHQTRAAWLRFWRLISEVKAKNG